jgi:hypothetical protein
MTAYGALEVAVTAVTRQMTSTIKADAEKAGDEAGRTLSTKISEHLREGTKEAGKNLAMALGTGVIALTDLGVEAVKSAARVDEMNTTLTALAKVNGLSRSSVLGTVDALRRQGITADAAQSVVADMVKEHLNLASATKLSTVAQNASIISGQSASTVLEAITKAVETGNTRQLRQAGLIINSSAAYKQYAAQIGTTASKLDQQQKSAAISNAVMEAGTHIAGVYAAAMNDPAKVLRSFPRLVEEMTLAIGENLMGAFGPIIVATGKFANALNEALQPGGKLAPVLGAVGRVATQMVAPFTRVMNLTTEWLDKLQPGTVNQIVGAVAKFGPVFASLATGLGAFAGGEYLSRLPLIGTMFEGLTGPLGAVVTGLVTLAASSPAARAALGTLASELMAGLSPVLKALVPAIGQLGNAVGVLLGAALQSVLPLVPPLVVLLRAVLDVVLPLVPVIVVLADVLARMAPVLVPLVAAWRAYMLVQAAYATVAALVTAETLAQVVAQVTQRAELLLLWVQVTALTIAENAAKVATVVWTAAQWLLNAALDANPIGIVVVALGLLVGALVLAWTHSSQFRTIVIACWQAIWTVVSPILHALTALVVVSFTAMRTAIDAATRWIRSNIQWLMLVLLGLFTGGLGPLVVLTVRYWGQIRTAIAAATTAILSTVTGAFGRVRDVAGQLMSQTAGVIAGWWRNIVSAATSAGGSIIGGLKSGMTAAISGIGGWIKRSVVDPIVNAVKGFFGIHSPSTVMAEIGGNLTRGLFLGMVPGMSGVGNLVGDVFGGFPNALAAMIGHGLIGIASLPGKALNAIMSLFGSGSAGALAKTASGFAGHRYVWGGGANANTGFDCSSFVNMLSGMLHLPIPGGFSAPSAQHGPVTGGWLGFGSMQHMPYGAMAMNDLFVSPVHMGVVTGPGQGFAARSTATGTGPQPVDSSYDILRFPGGRKLPSWLSGVMGKLGGLFGHLFGGGGSAPGGAAPGVARWAGVVSQVLQMFGRPDLSPVILSQMNTESGGNQFAVNNWDSNAAIGQNSRGLMQVIPATFAAFAGPFKNLGIFNPLANVYAAVAYAFSRYGNNLAAVLGHGHGYAAGGIVNEPVIGFGMHSGSPYAFGEAGPELVSPLSGPAASAGTGRVVINVYPREQQSETEIAAAVSRELSWAVAGGTA